MKIFFFTFTLLCLRLHPEVSAHLEAGCDDINSWDTTSLLQILQVSRKASERRTAARSPTKYFFFTEHKSGTVMALEVGCMMNAKLQVTSGSSRAASCEAGTNDVAE